MKDYGFAFNDADFSDRVLSVEIVSDDPLDSKGNQNLMEETASGKVKTLHVSSPILAKKSPFFYKLFKNGMRESQEKHLVLRIDISGIEGRSVDRSPDFIYCKTLSATTIPDLIKVLLVADKYEVVTCMRHCSELLLEFPMSIESANLYLDVPSSVLMDEAIKQLVDAATQYLDEVYKLQGRAMSLSLSDVELVLSSDDIRVKSEDDVLDFILKWAETHYPSENEYKEILNKRLVMLIRFPHMSSCKLEEVQNNPDFNYGQLSKLVRESLFFKAGLLPSDKECATNFRFIERDYELRPLKVVQFESSPPHCVVFFDLKKEECANLYPSNSLNSRSFSLGGRCFFLSAHCCKDQQKPFHHFGLFVEVPKYSKLCKLDLEFEVMKKTSMGFERISEQINFTLEKLSMGWRDLFQIPWKDFIGEESEYFIDGILHIRAYITIKNNLLL